MSLPFVINDHCMMKHCYEQVLMSKKKQGKATQFKQEFLSEKHTAELLAGYILTY